MPCPHRTRVARLGLPVVLTGALTASTSLAAPADSVDRARILFAEAESDEDGERWSEALEKLRAVAQVKLTAGVRYHIALCEEHLGQLARALGDYREAEDQARLENAQDVLRIVGKQVAALDPRVPRLTIRVVPAGNEVTVKLDGAPIAIAPIHGAVPVDPGTHYVVATTPDHAAAASAVTLQAYESRVIVLTLGEAPREAAPMPPSRPRSASIAASTPNPTPTSPGAAIGATALAIALAGGGAAAFLIAGAEHDNAVRTCPQLVPAPDACDWLKNRVRAWDFAAAGAWGGALIAATTALVLWAKRSGEGPTKVAVALVLAPTALGVRGRF